MRQVTIVLVGTFALVLVATACSPPATGPGESHAPSEVPEPVRSAVFAEVAERAGVSADEIEIMDAEYVEWPDACLGLPDEGEVCAQVITPGWQITVDAAGQTYTVHTNEDGTAIRIR